MIGALSLIHILVRVSRVVKVLETMMNRVVSGSRPLVFSARSFGSMLETVSYTHLDVYKRQKQRSVTGREIYSPYTLRFPMIRVDTP